MIEYSSGQGSPTLARILFSEEWEMKSENLRSKILKLKYEEFQFLNTVEKSSEEIISVIPLRSLSPFYESVQNTEKYRKLRMEVLQENITALQANRKSGRNLLMLPFTGTEFNDQFSDSITLEPEIEGKSFLLFPSKTRNRTKISEILSWCGEEDLCYDDDDLLLLEAELKGKKERQQELWNALEAQRLEDTRRIFAAEDREGRRTRTYWENIENQLNTFEKAEPDKRFFSLTNGFLPGSYDYITDSTTAYTHGSGKYCYVVICDTISYSVILLYCLFICVSSSFYNLFFIIFYHLFRYDLFIYFCVH
jgi:hypothetical protein